MELNIRSLSNDSLVLVLPLLTVSLTRDLTYRFPIECGSLFPIVRTLKRCSRLCLPCLHHQHSSESTHFYLSSKNGAISAWPLRSWSKRPAGAFVAARRAVLGLWVELAEVGGSFLLVQRWNVFSPFLCHSLCRSPLRMHSLSGVSLCGLFCKSVCYLPVCRAKATRGSNKPVDPWRRRGVECQLDRVDCVG